MRCAVGHSQAVVRDVVSQRRRTRLWVGMSLAEAGCYCTVSSGKWDEIRLPGFLLPPSSTSWAQCVMYTVLGSIMSTTTGPTAGPGQC